jgi:phosphatidylethanolamine-binding protein (PEBP) family uncharacterized protein
MRVFISVVSGLVILASLDGCGSSHLPSRGSQPTPASSSRSTTAQPTVAGAPSTPTSATDPEKSPAIDIPVKGAVPFKPIAAKYACHGADISPPLLWGKIPPHTAELDLFILSILPIHKRFDVAWGVAGIDPHLHHLKAGELPPGVVVGRNSSGKIGYSLCPPRRSPGDYVVLLYALPHRVHVEQGFDPEALVEGKLVHVATHEGETGITYKR